MLTIAKLRTQSVDYYLSTVASGIEDYYAGHGEAPGVWSGDAATQRGLTGDVDGNSLRGVLAGRLPGTPEPTRSATGKRTPGWDLTWSAPKSVSVLYGLGNDHTSRQVVAAHEAAIAEGMQYLNRWALVSRRRIDGEVTAVDGRGMIVAGFRHRTSRAMDPQLHTHSLIPNLVQRTDGTWGAIDSRILFRHAKTAGYVYQAVLRAELTRRLGVEWGTVTRGVAEASIVPEAMRALFSTRRREIEAELDARGASSIKASRVAALRTRHAKGETTGSDVLRARWHTAAVEADFKVTDLDGDIARVREGAQRRVVSRSDRRAVLDELMESGGLTRDRSTFNRADVVRAWCERIDTRSAHVTVDMIDDLVAEATRDRRSVLLNDADVYHGPADQRRWSTVELVALEQRILHQALLGRHSDVATVPDHALHHALRGSELTREQAEMITAITTHGHRVDVVVGIAGAGKTFALGVANELWASHGRRTIGVALAGQTAQGLERDTGIASMTIDRLLTQLAAADHAMLPESTVLIIDEAGMGPTRKLVELLDHCRPDTKIVLAGDHRQLPEIGAGGVMRSMTEHLTDAPVLTDNRRQQNLAEQVALAQLRHGSVRDAITWYARNGRIETSPNADAARHHLIETWWNDRTRGATNQLLMAERRIDVERLNQLARARFEQHGLLSSQRLHSGNYDYAVGDLVMFVRNDYDIGVRNGARGTVTAIDQHNGLLTVEVNNSDVDVPAPYLAAGHVQWGYAATVHKNQGSTCDHAYLLATDAMYRELGYVALSRGRIDNRIWIIEDRDADLDQSEPHGSAPNEQTDPIEDLIKVLERSNAQQLAIDQSGGLIPGRSPITRDDHIEPRDRIAGSADWPPTVSQIDRGKWRWTVDKHRDLEAEGIDLV